MERLVQNAAPVVERIAHYAKPTVDRVLEQARDALKDQLQHRAMRPLAGDPNPNDPCLVQQGLTKEGLWDQPTTPVQRVERIPLERIPVKEEGTRSMAQRRKLPSFAMALAATQMAANMDEASAARREEALATGLASAFWDLTTDVGGQTPQENGDKEAGHSRVHLSSMTP